jgi:hypothetical protein
MRSFRRPYVKGLGRSPLVRVVYDKSSVQVDLMLVDADVRPISDDDVTARPMLGNDVLVMHVTIAGDLAGVGIISYKIHHTCHFENS